MTSIQIFTLLLSYLYLQLDIAQSYVIDGTSSSSSSSIASRFHNTQCKLFVTIDRTPPPPVASTDDGTATAAYDDNFSSIATASKLGLPLDIQFTPSACTDFDMNNEALLQGNNNNAPATATTASPLLSLKPLNEPKFVTLSGQQSVKVTPGAYACQLSDPQTNQYFFRFFLDFPEGATRNDVTLPAERVYFMSSCWIKKENMIENAQRWKDEFMTSLGLLNREIEELENDPDNVGVVARARRIPHYIELLKQRKKLTVKIGMLEERFPLERPLVSGPSGMLLLKDGVVAVKREFGGKTRYHWIGTFSFKDFLDGGDDEMKEKEATKKLMP
mmetsp:Transcript_6130/g.9560  ORF Transcript_6130/g.9560 Transcript_6130/m.9560 type:complete len:331 (+) Transcript_6130:73-1065(+)